MIKRIGSEATITLAKGVDNQEFWSLWQDMYPVYKKIYPSMNPKLYRDKFLEKISESNGDKLDILICGAGDEDTLFFVNKVLGENFKQKDCSITLIDFCSTALERNKRFAEKNGLNVGFVFQDILKFRQRKKFQAIVSDGFIDFFDEKGKNKLLEKWLELLEEEGTVITTIPIEAPGKSKSHLMDYSRIAFNALKKKNNPFEKIFEYRALVHACKKLRHKGKNKAFKSIEEFEKVCAEKGFGITFFEPFYRYRDPSWMWYNCVLTKKAKGHSGDRLELINEIKSMVGQEKGRLEERIFLLDKTLGLGGVSALDKEIIQRNKQDVLGAVRDLEWLESYVKDKSVSDEKVFNEIIKVGNYVFRKSVSVRTSMLRHTPTLRGLPLSLEPNQNHLLSKKMHTVDYARGGYVLFQQPGKEPKTLFKDHPDLKKIAEEIKVKIYGESPNTKAVLFTCGLGAVNTFVDYLRSLSRKSGRKNFLGENCWLELKKHVLESNDSSFVFFDETDKQKIIELIKDESVQSIGLEGIQNYATLRASDLEEIFEVIKKTRFRQPKFLVLDHVVTFDSNVFEKYLKKMPKNFCLAAFVSGIKFFQGGFDIGKSGLLFLKYNERDFGKKIDPYQRVIEIRAGSGRVPSLEEAHISNIDTVESLKSRMKRYDRNMRELAKKLEKNFLLNGLGEVFSAWLPNHADYETANRCYSNGGRILYLKLDEKRFSEPKLLELYRHLADEAFAERVPLMAASNFGFCAPHIHMVRHNKVGLSLRISSGSTDGSTTDKIGDFVTKKIEGFA
ncbi:MAG: PLP-dependent transferase [Candidatus Diapherotrites archaeon]